MELDILLNNLDDKRCGVFMRCSREFPSGMCSLHRRVFLDVSEECVVFFFRVSRSMENDIYS